MHAQLGSLTDRLNTFFGPRNAFEITPSIKAFYSNRTASDCWETLFALPSAERRHTPLKTQQFADGCLAASGVEIELPLNFGLSVSGKAAFVETRSGGREHGGAGKLIPGLPTPRIMFPPPPVPPAPPEPTQADGHPTAHEGGIDRWNWKQLFGSSSAGLPIAAPAEPGKATQTPSSKGKERARDDEIAGTSALNAAAPLSTLVPGERQPPTPLKAAYRTSTRGEYVEQAAGVPQTAHPAARMSQGSPASAASGGSGAAHDRMAAAQLAAEFAASYSASTRPSRTTSPQKTQDTIRGFTPSKNAGYGNSNGPSSSSRPRSRPLSRSRSHSRGRSRSQARTGIGNITGRDKSARQADHQSADRPSSARTGRTLYHCYSLFESWLFSYILKPFVYLILTYNFILFTCWAWEYKYGSGNASSIEETGQEFMNGARSGRLRERRAEFDSIDGEDGQDNWRASRYQEERDKEREWELMGQRFLWALENGGLTKEELESLLEDSDAT
ncbi:hypothetical protein BDZ91DRAFT_745843 [Kalaharituber pfeilii]|nr:hypothetical protein BDZ91DRAFT_745843 [Kalaharituber pfeilii]